MIIQTSLDLYLNPTECQIIIITKDFANEILETEDFYNQFSSTDLIRIHWFI